MTASDVYRQYSAAVSAQNLRAGIEIDRAESLRATGVCECDLYRFVPDSGAAGDVILAPTDAAAQREACETWPNVAGQLIRTGSVYLAECLDGFWRALDADDSRAVRS